MNVQHFPNHAHPSCDYMIIIARHEVVARAVARKHFGWDPEHLNPYLRESEAVFYASEAEAHGFKVDLVAADRRAAAKLEVVA